MSNWLPVLQAEIRTAHDAATRAAQAAVAHAVEAGAKRIEAKELLRHGQGCRGSSKPACRRGLLKAT